MSDANLPADPERLPGLPPRTVYVESRTRDVMPDGEFLSLREALGVLKRNLWLIALATLVALGGTFWLLRSETQLYRADALIRLVDARGQMAGGMVASPQPLMATGADPLLSEIMVLTGRGVLGGVVDREGLRLHHPESGTTPGWIEDAEVRLPPEAGGEIELRFGEDAWTLHAGGDVGRAAYGRPATLAGVTLTVARPPGTESTRFHVLPRDLAIDLLQGGGSAEPRQGTNGIDLAFTAADPVAAQRTVNAWVEIYRETNASSAQRQSTARREFLQNQLEAANRDLIDAQARLAAFRKGQQVYSSAAQLSAQQSNLLELDLRRSELEADRNTYQALLDGLASGSGIDLAGLVSAPGISANPVVSQLYSRLVAYQASRDSATTGRWARAESNPDVERLDSLITSTGDALVAAVRSQIETVDARLEELGDLRERSSEGMTRLPDAEAQEVRLVQEVESYRALADQIRMEAQRAQMEEAVEAGQVEIVNLATRAAPVPLRHGLKLFLGGTIGLLLGGALAFLREHLNSSLVRTEEVEAALRVPSLAVIPRIEVLANGRLKARSLRPGRNGRSKSGAAAGAHAGNGSEPSGNGTWNPSIALDESPEIEAYRTLRTNLLFSRAAGELKTLVVTSAGPAEGKTVTVANLGFSFAQQGLRVLLIDADLKRPDLAHGFGFPSEPGLTEVLIGQVELRKAVRQTGVRDFHLLPSGTRVATASELLGGQQMERLIGVLRDKYDIVILDTPPVLAAPDATVLGHMSDAAVVVVRAGDTHRGAAESAMQQLERAGVRVVGAVVNDPDEKVPKYGAYYAYGCYREPVGA